MMRKALFLLLLAFAAGSMSGQTASPNCITASPICAGTTNTYPSITGGTTAETGPNYGCLVSQPNPSWFYFKIDTSGNLRIDIEQYDTAGNGNDVDFICWGPFSSVSTGCVGGVSSTAEDCSYSVTATEEVNINGALSGDYYLLMITNYSGLPGTVTFSVNAVSTAAISCDETCVTMPSYNSPLCLNGTLQLASTYHFGLGDYSWTGPNSFSSTLQNPTIPSVTEMAEGYYYLNYTRDSTCNYTDSIWVDVDTCGTLTGTVYADLNSNCAFDTLETGLPGVQLKLSSSGSFVAWAWTDPFGFYFFDVPVGPYTLEVNPSIAYPVTCASSLAHSVTVSASSVLTENFAIACNTFDLAAIGCSVTGLAFFPGQTKTLYPHHVNYGPACSLIPGQIVVVLDPLVHYTAAAPGFPAPVISPAATGDSLKWSVSDMTLFPYYGYSSFPFQYTTDISATSGDLVNITLIVYPTVGDANPSNNSFTSTFIVGNSYDPNSKEVIPAGIGPDGFIPASTQRLDYTVNFQNTGTAPAINIYILDTLDTNTDLTTLNIISASHPMTTTLLPGNVLKFNFSNIMLADSVSNEPESHGFVKYSIAPQAGLVPGEQIRNTANIYFDFNAPIVTNTTVNTIEFPVGTEDDMSDYRLAIYPNPTNDRINIQFDDKKSGILYLKLINVTGQTIYEENILRFSGSYSGKVDMSKHPSGLYFLQISTESEIINRKLIRN